jgi:NAD(P)-dependent dehydrogenase (short-subunit alcohol dehydrogenase family)
VLDPTAGILYAQADLSTENRQQAVIVTGGGSGIGRSAALRLAGDGFAVAVVDLDEAAAVATAEAVRARDGLAAAFGADISVSSECEHAVAAASELGRLHALVNVAGMMVGADTVEALADDELDRLLAVNIGGLFRLGRHAIPALRRSGGGVILNTSSVHAYASMDRSAAYAASKGAIVALTRQMAIDLAADRIRVVAVAPGSVDTPLTRSELERRGLTASEAGFGSDDELGRMLHADEIAAVISWLVSDAAGAINGQTIVADAGLLAKLV